MTKDEALSQSLPGYYSRGTNPEDSELVERLRAKVFAGPAEDQRLKLVAEEAADRLASLQADNARLIAREAELRVALQWVADHAKKLRKGTDDWFELVEFESIARTALNGGSHDPS